MTKEHKEHKELRPQRTRSPIETGLEAASVAHDRFLQSRNIKEAQQYLWEASLSHNSEDTVQLKMAIWHLGCELTNRENVNKLKKQAAATAPLNAEGRQSLMMKLTSDTTPKKVG